MTRLLMLLALVLGTLSGALAIVPATAQSEVVTDCEGCPELVPLADGAYIGRFHVTRDQFAMFAAETGFTQDTGCSQLYHNQWGVNPEARWDNPGFEQGGDHPVVCVTWLDATAYADWLSEKTGKPYRLPTIEESEAAAFADGPGPFVWGSEPTEVCANANAAEARYREAFADDTRNILTCDDGFTYTSPVSAFPPNSLGVYGGTGNAWQWTNSCLNGDCANAVFRGGGWNVPNLRFFQAGESFGDRILLKNFVIGFRVMRDPS